MTTSSLAEARDEIVASVARETGVPASEIGDLRARGRRAVDARHVAMWVMREVGEQGYENDETEVYELFGTRLKTVDEACLRVADTPVLFRVAQRLLSEHRPATSLGVG
jgi:chromosomal replication initiation ATPase DnaA